MTAFFAVAFFAARFLTVRVVVDFGGVAFFVARLAGDEITTEALTEAAGG